MRIGGESLIDRDNVLTLYDQGLTFQGEQQGSRLFEIYLRKNLSRCFFCSCNHKTT
jgi:hypothetical protein